MTKGIANMTHISFAPGKTGMDVGKTNKNGPPEKMDLPSQSSIFFGDPAAMASSL
ncbi:hypothetical protein BSNK01_20480 [Bacillaceae bacterium]